MPVQELTWYYPESIPDAIKLMKQGHILHAGGTRILKTKPGNLKGVVDIGALGLNYIRQEKNNIIIGAASTFTDVVKFSRKTGLLKALGNVLAESASTPLRNRITMGGSLKGFPLWTSIYAPLLALDAKIEMAGTAKKVCSLEDYLKKDYIKTKHIIKNIIVPVDPELICTAKKFTLIRFEYPLFVLAVSLKKKGNAIKESRIIISGVKGRVHRFTSSEKALIGKELTEEVIQKCVSHFSPKFHSDFRFTDEYKEHLAKVYFTDILNELRGETK